MNLDSRMEYILLLRHLEIDFISKSLSISTSALDFQRTVLNSIQFPLSAGEKVCKRNVSHKSKFFCHTSCIPCEHGFRSYQAIRMFKIYKITTHFNALFSEILCMTCCVVEYKSVVVVVKYLYYILSARLKRIM